MDTNGGKAMSDDLVRQALAILSKHLESAAIEISRLASAQEWMPHIDIAELEEAGWQTFQKQPAKPGEAAWLKNPVQFTDFKANNAVLNLVKALKRLPEQKLILGDMEYCFSKDEKFLNRKPVKQETAK